MQLALSSREPGADHFQMPMPHRIRLAMSQAWSMVIVIWSVSMRNVKLQSVEHNGILSAITSSAAKTYISSRDTNSKYTVWTRDRCECPMPINTKTLGITFAENLWTCDTSSGLVFQCFGFSGNLLLGSKLTTARGWPNADSHNKAASDAANAPIDRPSQMLCCTQPASPTNYRIKPPMHADTDKYDSHMVNSMGKICINNRAVVLSKHLKTFPTRPIAQPPLKESMAPRSTTICFVAIQCLLPTKQQTTAFSGRTPTASAGSSIGHWNMC